MENLDIKKGNRCFYIGESENRCKAEVTFVPAGEGTVMINHTYVSPELRGKKIAQKLIDSVADHCREKNLKIIPVCSYAVKVMHQLPKYEDILIEK